MAIQPIWMQYRIGLIWRQTHIMPQRAGPTKQKERDPLDGCLKGGCQEAFRKDSNLVKQIRHTYFRVHFPEFDNETTHDLTHIF